MGPFVLAITYIPLTIMTVPALILILGGGYLFGLPVGFVADSIGVTIGSTAALLLGRTFRRPYVISKLKDYPKFQAVAIASQRSGFKIMLLLRLVPLLPFNMLNCLLYVTHVGMGGYMIASWLGMMPITLALVYVGTILKDLADVTHRWSDISTTRWVLIILAFIVSTVLMVIITKKSKVIIGQSISREPGGRQHPKFSPITHCVGAVIWVAPAIIILTQEVESWKSDLGPVVIYGADIAVMFIHAITSLLKITAFTMPNSHHPLELYLTRENLSHFASELNIPFEFNILSLDPFAP